MQISKRPSFPLRLIIASLVALAFTLFGGLSLLRAQPVITENYITDMLDQEIRVVQYETPRGIANQYVDILAAVGPDQTYDFSGFNYVDSTVSFETIYEVPANDPYIDHPNFAGATHVWHIVAPPVEGGIDDTTFVWLYMKLEDNGDFVQNGAVSHIQLDPMGPRDTVLQWLDPPQLFLRFPVTINTLWWDSTALWNMFDTLTFQGSTMVDTMRAEGWGTAITPGGSAPVLRFFDYNMTTVPGPFPIISISTGLTFAGPAGPSASINLEDEWVFWCNRTPSITSATRNLPPEVAGFNLLPNYPNPFAESTTIKFTLDDPKNVRLRVVDMSGVEHVVVHEGYLPAGAHEKKLERGTLASGVYLLEMRIGGVVQIRQIAVQ